MSVERTALDSDPRLVAVETAVYADADERVAIASSVGVAGEYESSTCYAYLQALAEGEGARETGLGFGLARGPRELDPVAIGAEGAERALAMIGAGKPPSRSCPVVLDETVAASFAGLIGGGLSAKAVQRGRSPFAGKLGEEVASEVFALHDDGRDPEGPASAPFDGEGVPRRRTALIEDGRLRSYLYDTYTANREGTSSTGSAARQGYRSLPSVSTSNLMVAPGSLSLEATAGRGGGGDLRHRRRRAALRRQPGYRRLLGRRFGPHDPRRAARRAGARVHDRRRAVGDARGGQRRWSGAPLGSFWRLGQHAAAADRRDGDQRFVTFGSRARVLTP